MGEGAKGTKGSKGPQGVKGECVKGEDGVKGEKGEPSDQAEIPEPADDGTVYGRMRIAGDKGGDWERAVALKGDVMTGPLSSPALTTGPGRQ